MFNLKIINTNKFSCQLLEFDEVSKTLLESISDFILNNKSDCDYKAHGAYIGLIRHLMSLGLSERDAKTQVYEYIKNCKHISLQQYCDNLSDKFSELSKEHFALSRNYYELFCKYSKLIEANTSAVLNN